MPNASKYGEALRPSFQCSKAYAWTGKPSRLSFWIHATVILDVVKADADFANVLAWISRGPKANQHIHLAHKACRIIGLSDPDLAVTHSRLEVIEHEQGFSIDVDIHVTLAFAICVGTNLDTLQQMLEFGGPFNNGVLAQRHR